MSNIYIQEPPTSGKVLLKTSVGDIDIELWAKECPKACRNFIQLCMEGYYNGTIFHRVVKGFIVQGGDPNGDGTGGESIYGEPFKDEFHSRLRYARRGLVGMANSDKDDNASQFFFTMAATPELDNKNTLFGKVTGDTVFNMLKLEDGLVDHNERPMYPQKVIRAEILSNPFDDIQPRTSKAEKKAKKDRQQSEKGVKNFGLLSFGEEAEEDEEQTNSFVQQNAGKAKSMHDVVDDPALSKISIKLEGDASPVSGANGELSDEAVDGVGGGVVIKEEPEGAEERMRRIKEKLANKSTASKHKEKPVQVTVKPEMSDSDEDVLMTVDKEKQRESEKKKNEIRLEIQSLKKEYQTEKKKKDDLVSRKDNDKEATDKGGKANAIPNPEGNELLKTFNEEKEKYSNLKLKIPTKGLSREEFTLDLLKKFRQKLGTLKEKTQKDTDNENDEAAPQQRRQNVDDKTVEQEIQSDDWLTHTLKFEDDAPVLAKDASTKGDDWYDAYDPRNPLNKRRRGETRGGGGGGGGGKDSKRIKDSTETPTATETKRSV